MAEKPDTITQIAIELGVIFHPLHKAASSKDAFISFMRRLGWDADVVPDPVFEIGTAVDSLLTKVKSFFTSDFTLDDLVELKNTIETLIEGINGIKTIADADLPEKLSTENFGQNFPKELIEYLIANYLLRYRKTLGLILQALGVIKVRQVKKTGNRLAHIHYDFSFEDIPKIIDSPGLLFKNAFGWGTPDFDFDILSWIIQNLMDSIGTDIYIEKLDDAWIKRFDGRDPSAVTQLEVQRSPAFVFFERARTSGERLQAKINMIKLPANSTSMPGVAILPFFNGVNAFTMQLGEDITATITSEMDFAGGIAAVIRPSEGIRLLTGFNQTEIPSEAHAAFNVNADYGGGTTSRPVTILGSADASRIEFKGVGIKSGIGINSGDEVELLSEFRLKNLKVIIDLENSDGFIQKLIPIKHTEVSVDLTIGISSIRGIYFSGSATLEIRVPTHISLGPVEIQDTLVSIPFKNGGIGANIGLSLKAQLGPITAIVRDVGLSIDLLFPPQRDFFDFSVGFKPPSGAGLSVDAGGIKGGGTLDFNPEKGEYFGAIELEFKDLFSLKAFGIINTKMPDGSKNFSLLIIITAEFSPIQLGFGFTLNGVGGLLGVNRTTKVEVLKEGIKTNTLKSILFPEDVVANINRIVSDIKQVFPPQVDHFLICPMGKIGWGSPTIITLELGILIEIPAKGFIILGVLKALLPEEENPLLRLQVNFLGVIDFENKSISFDASLYDSKILTFTLTGDMALRLSFGDKPMFILSVGGFHPAFKEVPDDLKNMRRLTISLYDGANARIIIQTYFAVTSNTAQFGAKAELYAEKGSFNIYGFVSYDVLFQFSPFKFIADFGAGVALRRHSSVIMSIHVSGQLSGPEPWDAKGEASVSFFFFSVSV
ncbi:MAG TPA: DUF6603 domain-containing protein, partial [Chitinophagaceae bacterium]|nr:DUF6603 domain-containing protein [Chitinophagaceae bacterium]